MQGDCVQQGVVYNGHETVQSPKMLEWGSVSLQEIIKKQKMDKNIHASFNGMRHLE